MVVIVFVIVVIALDDISDFQYNDSGDKNDNK